MDGAACGAGGIIDVKLADFRGRAVMQSAFLLAAGLLLWIGAAQADAQDQPPAQPPQAPSQSGGPPPSAGGSRNPSGSSNMPVIPPPKSGSNMPVITPPKSGSNMPVIQPHGTPGGNSQDPSK